MKPKVLVAESDAATLELMREIFTLHGISIRPVNDAAEVANLINQQKFDAVFMDLDLPGVDGVEFIRRIRQSSWNKRTPIVIIPERRETHNRLEAFKAGATFFLEKPLDRTLFTRLLRSTQGTIAEERRRFARIPLQTQVQCGTGGHELLGMSCNLSREGIMFQGDGTLKRGHRVKVSFRLEQHKPAVCAEGVVTRVDDKQRVAVRFVPLAPDDAQRLREFIARRADAL